MCTVWRVEDLKQNRVVAAKILRQAHSTSLLRFVREGINVLLPVASVGGDVVGGRLLTFWGVSGALAAASILVDMLFQVGTQVADMFNADKYRIAVKYADKNVLQSGLLTGESYVAGKGALVTCQKGAGEVVLYGFGPQNRAQTTGTYKLLFNMLYR